MSGRSTCTICKLEFKNVLKKKIHEQKVHVFIFQCVTCQTKYKTSEDLEHHIVKSHKSSNNEPGPIKEVVEESEIESREHENKENSATDISVECEICEALFESEEELTDHTITEHPPTIEVVECIHCGELFKLEQELESHLKSEHFFIFNEESRNIKYISKEEKKNFEAGNNVSEFENVGNVATLVNNKKNDDQRICKTKNEEITTEELSQIEVKEDLPSVKNQERKAESGTRKHLQRKKKKLSLDPSSYVEIPDVANAEENIEVEEEEKIKEVEVEKKELKFHAGKQQKIIECSKKESDEMVFKATQIENIKKHQQNLISKLEYLKTHKVNISVKAEGEEGLSSVSTTDTELENDTNARDVNSMDQASPSLKKNIKEVSTISKLPGKAYSFPGDVLDVTEKNEIVKNVEFLEDKNKEKDVKVSIPDVLEESLKKGRCNEIFPKVKSQPTEPLEVSSPEIDNEFPKYYTQRLQQLYEKNINENNLYDKSNVAKFSHSGDSGEVKIKIVEKEQAKEKNIWSDIKLSGSNKLKKKSRDKKAEIYDELEILSQNANNEIVLESTRTGETLLYSPLNINKSIKNENTIDLLKHDATNHLPMRSDKINIIFSEEGSVVDVETPMTPKPKSSKVSDYPTTNLEALLTKPGSLLRTSYNPVNLRVNKGFSIFDIDHHLPYNKAGNRHDNQSLLSVLSPLKEDCKSVRNPDIENIFGNNISETNVEIEAFPSASQPKSRGKPKKINSNAAMDFPSKSNTLCRSKKRGRPKKMTDNSAKREKKMSTNEQIDNEDQKHFIKRGRGRPRKMKDLPSYLPTLVDGYSSFVINPSFSLTNVENSGEASDMEVKRSVADLQELLPLVDDFNSLGHKNIYHGDPEDNEQPEEQTFFRNWTQSPSQNNGSVITKISQRNFADLGFDQPLSDSEEDEHDNNDNKTQDAGFLTLLSDSESEDETNNNKQNGQETGTEAATNDNQEVRESNVFDALESISELITKIHGPVSPNEASDSMHMHTLVKPRYDVEMDNKKTRTKWISDISVGSGWKLKRKGPRIIYKDKKGSIFKTRFTALKQYISISSKKI